MHMISLADAQKLLAELSDGKLTIEPPKPERLTVKEQRARDVLQRLTSGQKVGRSLAGFDAPATRAMQEIPEPKRQRKTRVMQPRKVYRLRNVDSRDMIEQLQTLTAAARQIIVYLASHEKATVPQLSIDLDLRRKTVQNLLSTLSAQKLVESSDRF